MFDGQMWLGPGRILTGIFRYYNSSNDTFPDIGQYFSWIHVAKFDPPGHTHTLHTNEEVDLEPETERKPRKGQTIEDTLNSDGSWDTIEEPDVVHVVGDIIRIIPTKTDELRQQPYINISGAAINSNKNAGFFEVNATQYTSHYKSNRALSILPVQAHFNSNKYRNKKPIPSNNTFVSLEGFLEEVETDANGHATHFRVSVDNINFLGRAALSPSTTGTIAPSTPSRSSRFRFNFDISSPDSSTEVPTPGIPSSNITPQPEAGTEAGMSTRGGKRKK